MREMKDSGVEWIGEIPCDWKVTEIKREYKFQTGWTPDTKNNSYFEGDNIWVNISDLKSRIVYDSQKHISDEAVNVSSMCISPKGSLMYAFKLSVGTVGFCGVDMYTNEAIATFLEGKNSLRYLYYIAPLFIIENANENIYGAKLLNQQLIKSAKIVLPTVEVQEKIAAYLDSKCSKIDAIIEKQQAIIEKLKEYKLSVITEAVTKGLDPNVEMKDSKHDWIGTVPKTWEIYALSSIVSSIRNGYVGPTREILVESGVPYIQSLHVKDGQVSIGNTRYFVSEEWGRKHPKIHEGQILVVQTGAGLGQIGLVPKSMEGYNCHALIIISVSPSYAIPEFVTYYFRSVVGRELLLDTRTGATLPHLNSGKIKSTPIVCPTIEEQRSIVEHLNSKCKMIDNTIILKEKVITNMNEYKKSLIYEVVTGKKEV